MLGPTSSAEAETPSTGDALEIQRYEVKLAIRPVERPYPKLYGGEVDVVCDLTLKNAGGSPCADVPLYLYRLLEVRDAAEAGGAEVPFVQVIETAPAAAYGERCQMNRVTLRPAAALQPGEVRRMTVRYGGPICGRPESFAYVWDHVSWEYTLLRGEVNWYPTIAYTRFGLPRFVYHIDITVPSQLIAVTEGTLTATRAVGDTTTYSYENEHPTFLLSVAAARFETREVDPTTRFCFLPEDGAGVDLAITALERTRAWCAKWFGTTPKAPLTVVEVPDGYGSQAAPGLILQVASAFAIGNGDREAAFRNALNQLGHEEIHRWHPDVAETDRTRLLDEGLTHYVQSLVLKHELGEEAYDQQLEGSGAMFLRGGAPAADTPIADPGDSPVRDEIARGKGPWMFRVLHQWLGEEAFFRLLKTYFTTYQEEQATYEDFVSLAKRVAGSGLDRFFQEWLWGTESSRYLADGLSAEEMAAKYR